MSEAGGPHASVPRVGVLLVHGMGSATEGDTIRSVGMPLWQALRRRAPDVGFDVAVVRADGLDGADDEPAHVSFEVRDVRGGEPASWWLAECHWGDAFRPPSYGQVVTWVLLAVPWTLIGYLRGKWQDCAATVGRTGTGGRGRVAGWSAHRLASSARELVLTVLALLAALLLGPVLAGVVVLVLIVVLPLSKVPLALVSNPSQAVIRQISASLGDVHMLASETFDRRAVDARLERDLRFLFSRCDQVAFVAHSAGSYLSHCLLQKSSGPQEPAPPDKVPLLVTYGQAVWRVHAVNQLGKGGGHRKLTVGLTVLAVAMLCLAGWLIPRFEDWVALLPAAVGVLACGFTYYLICRAADVVGRQPSEGDGAVGLGLSDGRRWRDYVAGADPVPDGFLMPALVGTGRSYEGVQVHNRRSVVSDHNTYVSNDVFLDSVAWDVFELAGRTPAGHTDLDGAWVRRRGRTRWLSTARATFWVIAGTVVTAATWSDHPSPAARTGQWLAERLPAAVTKHVLGVGSQAGSGPSLRATSVAVLLIVAALVLAYSLLRWTWEWWDTEASSRAARPPDRTGARRAAVRHPAVEPTDVRTAVEGRSQRRWFLLVWCLTLGSMIGVTACLYYGFTPAAQRLSGLPELTVVIVLLCGLAMLLTTSSTRAAGDAGGMDTWHSRAAGDAARQGRAADSASEPLPAAPVGTPSPAAAVGRAGWQEHLSLPEAWTDVVPDATGVVRSVLRDGTRVCLESTWVGRPTATVPTPIGAPASSEVELRVVQTLESVDGRWVTCSHYVDASAMLPAQAEGSAPPAPASAGPGQTAVHHHRTPSTPSA